MLMSKSRLEKFLYALYSLDSSDLPNPLSRIEELYKCWVTGEEVSTFKPLSRVEKYLMAILGVYDVNELPNPTSRVEVLLHKLATGDDNLDDIKSFLSEHEELLAEIIRNGGVGGNIDIEYVLYTLSTEFNTLYNTAEKPIKSAILKGNTEGMSSVKMPVLTTTGKNLFDISKEQKNITINLDNGDVNTKADNRNTSDFIKVTPNTIYKCNVTMTRLAYYDKNKQFISCDTGVSYRITIPTSCNFVKFSYDNALTNIQFEQGSIATSYEPFKTNILTANEEVELRGIGEVQDELDLVTGEVTQRIGEVVFDGSEDWVLSAHENSTMFYTSFNNLVHKKDYLNSISCDKLVLDINDSYLINSTSPNGISAYADWAGAYPNENWIYIKYADSEGYVEKLKQWLSQNPITVQYELATESVKTVDLSVVDQDGNDSKLSTFDDLTHVTLSSEGLIPEVELEVATKNEEVLSTLSLEMDDISTSQNTLEETANTQSENVDATMIATTEIYEELL